MTTDSANSTMVCRAYQQRHPFPARMTIAPAHALAAVILLGIL